MGGRWEWRWVAIAMRILVTDTCVPHTVSFWWLFFRRCWTWEGECPDSVWAPALGFGGCGWVFPRDGYNWFNLCEWGSRCRSTFLSIIYDLSMVFYFINKEQRNFFYIITPNSIAFFRSFLLYCQTGLFLLDLPPSCAGLRFFWFFCPSWCRMTELKVLYCFWLRIDFFGFDHFDYFFCHWLEHVLYFEPALSWSFEVSKAVCIGEFFCFLCWYLSTE